MTCYKPSESPVFAKYFAPLEEAYAMSSRRYGCGNLTDLGFLEMGVMRCMSASRAGREFLQHHGGHGRKEVPVDLFFKALKSGRRLGNLTSCNPLLRAAMTRGCPDPFADIPELAGFDIHAGDGHYHKAACHDAPGASGKRRATGHFFMLDMRIQHMWHLAHAQATTRGGNEHDMHAIKRTDLAKIRHGAPAGRKVIVVWDRAGVDFGHWMKLKRGGVYFVCREKKNMAMEVIGDKGVDRADARNAGAISDELAGPASGGAMLRRITFKTHDGKTYTYLTNEMTLPPGVVSLLYKQRRDIEKVFDEFKNKMAGAGWAATKLQRFTVRSVKFVRWNQGVRLPKGPLGPRRGQTRGDKVFHTVA